MSEQGRKFSFFKEDIKDLIECFNEMDDIKNKKTLLDWIDSCAEYTVAVVEHVAYEKEFIGNSNESTREEMERLNKKRTQKHNNAIRLTMGLNRILNHATGNGAYFLKLNNIELDNINSVVDITSKKRYELGQLFFQTSSVIASLAKEEVKELGLEELKNKVRNQTYRHGNIAGPTKEGYVKDADSIYDEIR